MRIKLLKLALYEGITCQASTGVGMDVGMEVGTTGCELIGEVVEKVEVDDIDLGLEAGGCSRSWTAMDDMGVKPDVGSNADVCGWFLCACSVPLRMGVDEVVAEEGGWH